jgi:organic hydroperoxide reductase OsmC/OhrA
MAQTHVFEGDLVWTGKSAAGADGKLGIARDFLIEFHDKAPIAGSSPAVFKGDDSKHNPETLMLASLVACHHLTYVAVCERAGITLVSYTDHARGTLGLRDGKMRYIEVVLKPQVKIADAAQRECAVQLHDTAHANCFMANSVNFEVRVEPTVSV